MMTPSSGGRCEPCSDSDKAPAIIAAVCVALWLLALYLLTAVHRNGKSHGLSVVLVAIAGGQLVTTLQQMGIVGMLAIDWEEPLKSMLQSVQMLTLDLPRLKVNCVGSISALGRYMFKLSLLLLAVLFTCLIHFLKVVLRHEGRFSKHTWTLAAALAALLSVSYITVATTVLEPLQCKGHPNRKWTLPGQSIICWESDEHRAMLVVGALVFFFGPVLFLVSIA
eukprot:2766351-Amphidinium_carterae.1